MSCSAPGGFLREPPDLLRWKPRGAISLAASLRTLPWEIPTVEALLKHQNSSAGKYLKSVKKFQKSAG